MKRSRMNLLALLLSCGAPVAASGAIPAGSLVVATDSGVYWHSGAVGAAPVLLATAASLGGLSSPAVEWERGTDNVLLVDGGRMLRLQVTGSPPAGVLSTDITPILPGTPLLFDLDVHPATGDIFILDRGNGMVHRLAGPVSAGASPTQSFQVLKSSRGLAVDSRSNPLSVVTSDGTAVVRTSVPSGAVETVAFLPFGVAVDCEPQIQNGAIVCRKNDHEIVLTVSNPNLVVDINLSAQCKPVALGPVDGEWDPIKRRLFVLAEDGVNGCAGFFFGGNHLVRFQVPGGGPNPPVVLTPSSGSGIAGKNGDVAVIHDDFAYSGVFAPPCEGPLGAPRLDQRDGLGYLPEIGNAAFALRLEAVPTGAVAVLLLGASPTPPPYLACQLAVAIATVSNVLVPTGGQIDLTIPIPNNPALVGVDAWLQAAVGNPASGAVQLTPGLRVHLGL